ncbi:MAG: histidine phosphatase family protein [Saprospiraceae bacterium]|nr:histidine phosphatase family protein [Saprospiraceae bacterium]
MRTLYLVRHAKSSWGNPGLRDHDRPLNDRGLHDAPRMARLLVEHGVQPDLLVSSPAKRALTTALFFAEAFGIADEAVRRDPDIYEAFPQEILRIISQLPDSATTVLIFGHNPTFTDVANRFSEDDFLENVPTCGVVKITSSAASWKEFYEGNSKIAACFFPKEVL